MNLPPASLPPRTASSAETRTSCSVGSGARRKKPTACAAVASVVRRLGVEDRRHERRMRRAQRRAPGVERVRVHRHRREDEQRHLDLRLAAPSSPPMRAAPPLRRVAPASTRRATARLHRRLGERTDAEALDHLVDPALVDAQDLALQILGSELIGHRQEGHLVVGLAQAPRERAHEVPQAARRPGRGRRRAGPRGLPCGSRTAGTSRGRWRAPSAGSRR